ncbi:MAG: hypothetical protein K0Q93_2720 [Nocardioidaceae bacterium]|jgi:hypothetical protein|nr:hypothetical protein [Nocardioidaceae bacterium]
MDRLTKGLMGGLLLLAGLLVFVVPAVNVWPFALGFWAVGLGLVLPVAIQASDGLRGDLAARAAEDAEVRKGSAS